MNELQNKILEIYSQIKRICDENDIRFYAIGGTAIGAERHNGFIPWDDDLDIAMPNKDFDRFVNICKTQLPSNLRLFLPEDSKHSVIFWAKVHDINTAFLEINTYKWVDYRYGVFVDIMPMFGLPDKKGIASYRRKVRKYRILSSLQRNDLKQMPLKKKIVAIILKPLNLLLPSNYWLKKLSNYQSRFDFDRCKKTGYTWSTLKENLIFDRKWFDGYYDLPFEGTTIRCCFGNKEMLTKQFGDYMKLPPESSRFSNHLVKTVDLYNSYRNYDNKGELK